MPEPENTILDVLFDDGDIDSPLTCLGILAFHRKKRKMARRKLARNNRVKCK